MKTRCQHNLPDHLCPECGDGMEGGTIMKTAEFIEKWRPRIYNKATYTYESDKHKEYESDLDALLKKVVEDAISDYLQDKSDKPHINTLEDWVNDWIENYE